jgi:predicted PhzF superfamily epimerase YddE/YHI9
VKARQYKVVDVFGMGPLQGNPVAVVLDADELDTAAMQAIASWTNLSETTFLLRPTRADADYRLRIFTPRSELPFAGHPTLGSAHAALEAGRVVPRHGRLVQECGVGLVELPVEGVGDAMRLQFKLPPAKLSPLGAVDIEELEGVLGQHLVRETAPAIVDVGPRWVIAQLQSADAVVALKPDFVRSAAFEQRLGVTGITVFAGKASGNSDIEVRSFAPSDGVDEDPVCGSGNGSVAAFRLARGLVPEKGVSYVASQGRCVGRDGRVDVRIDAAGLISLGGACVTAVDGFLRC